GTKREELNAQKNKIITEKQELDIELKQLETDLMKQETSLEKYMDYNGQKSLLEAKKADRKQLLEEQKPIDDALEADIQKQKRIVEELEEEVISSRYLADGLDRNNGNPVSEFSKKIKAGKDSFYQLSAVLGDDTWAGAGARSPFVIRGLQDFGIIGMEEEPEFDPYASAFPQQQAPAPKQQDSYAMVPPINHGYIDFLGGPKMVNGNLAFKQVNMPA
ncbi:MAG: hypothetical protein AAGI66_09160, partial [Cyanobacteria bacterium P01_H01_bin.74]